MDTIADFLTIIRNGYLAKKTQVSLNSSKMRAELAKILKQEGFIVDFEKIEAKPNDILVLTLRYFEKNMPAVSGIKRVSKSSVRTYSAANEIPRTLSGAGLTIVSTSAGLMTDKAARTKHLGGEIICQVW